MCHPCHLVSQPLSRWTWDLRVPTLFLFQSISILLHANTSLIALQCLDMYLFSIPTWRLIVCALGPVHIPHILHPHADSLPSYRCLSYSILIPYMCLQPCGSIL